MFVKVAEIPLITDKAQLIKKLPAPIYKLAAQAFIDYRFPRHLFVETTATCNLACSYCPREKVKGDMDLRLFEKIIDEASNYGPRSFSLHLFGEPLLYKYWMVAIKYIKMKNSKHTVLLTTNGTKLNEYVDLIVKLPIDRCLWSWRKEAKFTPRTVEKLKAWKPFTVRYIEGTYPEEALEEKWPRVEKRRVHNYGGEIDTTKYGATNTKNGIRYPCYHLFLAPAVSWNGKFLMCCADPHQKEVFGDINHEKISGCWEALGKVRESHLKGEFSGICEKCDVWREYPNIFFGHEFQEYLPGTSCSNINVLAGDKECRCKRNENGVKECEYST